MCRWCHDQLDVRVYDESPLDGAIVVCPCPDSLLITVPVGEADLSEELPIAIIRQRFFREVAWLLNCEGAGMTRVYYDFPEANPGQHSLKGTIRKTYIS